MLTAYSSTPHTWLLKYRLDLTEHHIYTLSPGTKNILAALNTPIELSFFSSNKAIRNTPDLESYAGRVEGLLKAYEREANGRITLQTIDPIPFSDDEDKADTLGLHSITLPESGKQAYLGLVASEGKNINHIIPFLPPDREMFLEYEVSRLIQGMASNNRPRLGLISGLTMDSVFSDHLRKTLPPWRILQEIRQQFDLTNLSMDVAQIPQDINILMLVQPEQLTVKAAYAIDQFVLRGGKLILFLDPLSESHPDISMNNPEVSRLLKSWGIQLQPGKILGDRLYAMSTVIEDGQRPVRHPTALGFSGDALSEMDISTAGLWSITASTAGVIEPLEHAASTFTPIIRSSEDSSLLDHERLNKEGSLNELMTEITPTHERYTVAARITGMAETAFPEGIEGHKKGMQKSGDIHIVLVADTDLLTDRLWTRATEGDQVTSDIWADNAAFVMNALDNLSGSNDLINVRSRARISYPLSTLNELRRQAENRFHEKIEGLEKLLEDAESELSALQKDQTAEDAEMSELAIIQKLNNKRLHVRKELREIQLQLDADIERTEFNIKMANIITVPLLLSVFALIFSVWRQRRRR